MLDVCLLGTGGMMPLPYRWLTSLMVRYNGSSLLIDCGEGTQIAIKEKGWSFKPIDVRSYQWITGTSPYNGKCRPDGTIDIGWPKRAGTGCQCTACDRAGASVSYQIYRNQRSGADT